MNPSIKVVVLSPQQAERMKDRVDFVDMTQWDTEAIERVLSNPDSLNRDSLTGLVHRREAMKVIEDQVASWTPDDEPLSTAFLDLDYFKRINDAYGHAEGDAVLAGVGNLLSIPREGLVLASRFGGEEFLLLFRVERPEVNRALEELRTALSTLRLPSGEAVAASFGVSVLRPGEGVQDLLMRTDQNLYQAKSTGRNRIVSDTDGEGLSPFETDLRDFENRVRVFADRMVASLTSRGRKLALGLRDEADHDGLTGLNNRRYFDRRLVREMERARQLGSPLTLVLLDLDDFGAVNRDHGYPAGDSALREAALELKRSVRLTDWTARYGGEELVGVFPDTDGETAGSVAERLRGALAELEPQAADGSTFRISGSLGVVTLGAQDTTPELFIQRAGLAVRASKGAGKNRVTVVP